MLVDPRGVLLTSKVDIEWLKNLEPQYFGDFIKFVIYPEKEYVFVGMQIHAHANGLLDGKANTREKLYGGNLFYDGHIEWESGLNMFHNERMKLSPTNYRFIEDSETISMLNKIFRKWVAL